MNINVKAMHFHVDAKLLSHVEKKLSRLGKIYNRIEGIDVHLKLQDTGGKIQEKITEVHMHVPGGWLIDRKTGQSFESAINASTETLKRQLARYKEKLYSYEPEKMYDRSPHT